MLDNLAAHKHLQIRALIEERGARVLFVPPYSPELNPIELAWARIKNTINKLKPRSLQALDNAVARALPEITGDDAAGWLQHCGNGVHN